MLHRTGLQRPQLDCSVKGVPGNHRPVIEVALAERLALGVVPQVRLKPEGFDGGEQGSEGIHRGAGLGRVSDDVPTALGEHGVDGRHAVRRRLYLHGIHRLHEARGGHEERRVRHPARGGNHLPAAAVQGLLGDGGVQDLEFDVADGLVAQRALAGAPLEPLHHALAHRAHQALVHLCGQGVVQQRVGPPRVGTERPHRARCKDVPVVVVLEKITQLFARPLQVHCAGFDVACQPLIQGLGDHSELVALVGRLREALEAGRFHHRLAEGHHRVCYLDLHLGVQVPQVLHHRVQEDLPCAHDRMLAALLHLGHRQRVALVDLAQALHHLRQVAGVERLGGDLYHRLVVEHQRGKHVALLVGELGHQRRRLADGRVHALDENPVAGGGLRHGDAVARLVHPQLRHRLHRAVLLVVRRVRLAQHANRLPLFQRSAHHAPQRVKRGAVILGIEFGDHHLQRAGGVARAHGAHRALVAVGRYGAAVGAAHLAWRSFLGRRKMRRHHVHQPRGVTEDAFAGQLDEGLGIHAVVLGLERDAELGQHARERRGVLPHGLRVYFVQRLQDELHKGALAAARGGLAAEHALVLVKIRVSPQPPRELLRVHLHPLHLGVQPGERLKRE
mmetsp:Transcript_31851/g.51004  ORF Transcript_31851/g.51004 Transcript_31851/m.51004 type:complete len:617 (+) Transcript_31851:1240-3090(+)